MSFKRSTVFSNTWNIFQFLDGFKRSLFVTKANNLLCFFAPIPEIVCSSASVALLRLIFPPDFAEQVLIPAAFLMTVALVLLFGHVNNHLIFYFLSVIDLGSISFLAHASS